jgi:hypothetical protein
MRSSSTKLLPDPAGPLPPTVTGKAVPCTDTTGAHCGRCFAISRQFFLGASWSLNWPSGANLLAHLQLKCILYVPL